MLTGLLPSWVEPDPLRARATDALGLQATADRLADRLLPGLSVLTVRARYFTFLAWAREVDGRDYQERNIHRLEVALALTEASLSGRDAGHAEACRFVGSRNIESRKIPLDRVPLDPRRVYSVPVWRAYRASMIALDLIEASPYFSLKDNGAAAAHAFRSAVRPRFGGRRPLPARACLSEIASKEKQLLRHVLGLSLKGRLDLESGNPIVRRAAFAREMRDLFWRNECRLWPGIVLPHYERLRSAALSEPAGTLREAAVWERLSMGLNVLFTVWVRAIEQGRRNALEKRTAELVTCGLRCPAIGAVDLTDESSALATSIASLRCAIRLHDELGFTGAPIRDAGAFEMGRAFTAGGRAPRERITHAFDVLLRRHRSVKGDEAWVRAGARNELELARGAGDTWIVPPSVRPHAYRMSAFGQIAADLGGL